MEKLKKDRWFTQWRISFFLFMMILSIPVFASLQKGESYIIEGKIDEAVITLTPFVQKKDPHAFYLMAIIYLSPTTKYYNFQKGFFYLQQAVFQNYAPALDELAGLYLAGEGVEKNEAKALHFYIQASHLGYGPSQFNCGIMYKNGQGIKPDLKKAYLYLSLASLNYNDLGDVALDAAHYRDEVACQLSPQNRQDVLRQINTLTLPIKIK